MGAAYGEWFPKPIPQRFIHFKMTHFLGATRLRIFGAMAPSFICGQSCVQLKRLSAEQVPIFKT